MTSSAVDRHREIVALLARLRRGDPGQSGRRELVAALCSSRGELSAVGETQLLGAAEAAALGSLTEGELRAIILAVDPRPMEFRLEAFLRASDDNGDDVRLAQPEAEAEALVEQGCRLLYERQDLENLLAGLAWILRRRPELSHLGEDLVGKRFQTTPFDRILRGSIRHFIALNRHRRSNRNAYPDPIRFWWWHVLSDCDLEDVYLAAEGGEPGTPHLPTCRLCGEWLRRLREVQAMLRRSLPGEGHPSADDLLRLRQGELTGEEEEGLDWHVKLCGVCSSEMGLLGRSRRCD
jgi:hypothetical protein